MSHCGTSSFNPHLDHCFVVLEHIQQSFLMRKLDVWGNGINIIQNVDHSLRSLGLARDFCHSSQRVAPFYHRSESCFQGLKQSDPINRERESHPISSQRPKRWFLILLSCEKQQFCFFHTQLTGTNVWLPKIHETPLEVDFESSRSPAKSDSWNQTNLQCCAVFPTWQYCRNSLVWWM